MTDWNLLLIQLQLNYKPLSQIAQNMLYANSKKIVDLHDKYCKGDRK